ALIMAQRARKRKFGQTGCIKAKLKERNAREKSLMFHSICHLTLRMKYLLFSSLLFTFLGKEDCSKKSSDMLYSLSDGIHHR
ncbi:MAG: hypothetical protein LKJ88_06915, partial [Bacilli bacterium]|nr:hypothetical protein [Bacilli bacterium]